MSITLNQPENIELEKKSIVDLEVIKEILES